MTFKVTFTGLRERLQQLDHLEREQLPFAAALALTSTAQEVKAGLVEEMQSVFDRPTRATLNSLFIQPATKARMEARVWIKDGLSQNSAGNMVGTQHEWDKGSAATVWLTPQVRGGLRNQKGTERMLNRRGVLPAGKYVMPGKGIKLDSHGNIPRGTLTKILSGAGLFTEEGYDANATRSGRSSAKGNSKRYFLMRKGRQAIGVAERTGWGKGSRNKIKMVLAFTDAPSYSRRFRFFEVAEAIAEDQLPIQFEKAMARALATRAR